MEDLLASDRVVFGLECPVLHEALVGDKDIGSSRILGKHVSGYNWTTGEMSLLPATSNGTVAGTTVTPSTAGGTICASVANNNNINTSGVFSSSTINATTTNTSSQPPPPPAPTLPQLSGSWPHEDIFRLILTSRPNSVNPAASENLAIRVASMWGLIDMIHLLLADPRVDCEAADHESVRSASDGRVLYDSLGMERSVVHRNVLDVLFARYVRKHGMDVAMDVWREIARQENEFGSPMLKEVCEDVFSEAKKRLLKK